MRTADEMYELILTVARGDDRVRAVYLNGSRVDPNQRKDIFQDFDVVYAVTETASFLSDPDWIRVFGERLLLQEPDRVDAALGKPMDPSRRYAYLMQFRDGNRIDLTLQSLEVLVEEYGTDKLTVPLLDKDGRLPSIPAPSDEDHWVQRPTQAVFSACCNEFWWVAPYCAKGLWRREILYAADAMNAYVRPQLLTLLRWSAGIRTDFRISLGKADKHLDEHVEADVWDRLLKTYDCSGYPTAWEALDSACGLFAQTAPAVAGALGLAYDETEAENSMLFIRRIRELPATATGIF
jgi:aminoglycoside 6-adenylyltransferase